MIGGLKEPASTTHRNKAQVVILALFLISLMLRIIYLNAGLFHHDAVYLANSVELFVDTGVLIPVVEGRQMWVLLNSLTYFIPHHIFGVASSELSLNLTTALFGAIAVVFMYLFTWQYFKNRFLAFASSLMLAFNTFALTTSTHTRGQPYSMVFVLASFYFLQKAIQTSKNNLRLLSGILLGLSLFVRMSNLPFIFPHIILMLAPHLQLNKKSEKATIVREALFTYSGFIVLLIAAFLILDTNQFGTMSLGDWINFSYKPNYVAYLVNYFQLFLPFPGFFLAAIGVAMMILKKQKAKLAFLFSWVLVYCVFYSHSNIWYKISEVSPRYFSVPFIPFIIFVAFALSEIHGRVKYGKTIAYILLGIVVIVSFIDVYPIIYYRHHHAAEKELALFALENTESNSIVIALPDQATFFRYYANKDIIVCPETINEQTVDIFTKDI
ncbi:glycosyltransferase family 39 protein, partial [Candidatus Woesearchaeota archaeon]|nr:glycosyltransferase family 39 protein [Candidatus Woesearchaeota archaeon]